MTREEREEAIEALCSLKISGMKNGKTRLFKALETAIEALKAEPCEDAISRQAVLDVITANCIWENEYNLTSSRIKNAVEKLPPVTPKPRTGKWKWKIGGYNDDFYVCDCGFKYVRVSPKYNYCPKCGAKMDGNMEGEGE